LLEKNKIRKGISKLHEQAPKSPPLEKKDTQEAQFKWEMEHKGGYRLIYPAEDTSKYDKFFTHNQVSLYQETAASQARATLTRAQLDEYNVIKNYYYIILKLLLLKNYYIILSHSS